MPESRRVLIAGSGAIGSLFGAYLQNAGHAVTLLGRRRHLDAIAAHGLCVDGIWGTSAASGFELLDDAGGLHGAFDLIVIAVKSYDTDSLLDRLDGLLSPDGVALSLQNGLGNVERIAKLFGPARSMGASVLVGATIPRPGVVTVTVQAAPIVFGPLDASLPHAMARAREWGSVFGNAGLPCEATERLASFLWSKVFYNAALNAVGALLDVHYGALGDDPSLRTVMDRVIDEAFAVSKAEGVSLPWDSPDGYRAVFYGSLVPDTYVHRSSMLQDLERGRRTEIDVINGEIWRRGQLHGIPTPFNELLTLLISGRSRRALLLGDGARAVEG